MATKIVQLIEDCDGGLIALLEDGSIMYGKASYIAHGEMTKIVWSKVKQEWK